MAIIPDQGKQWIIDKVQDVAPLSNAKCDVGWCGTGAVAEAAGNIFANVTEVTEARVAGATLSQPTAATDRAVFTMTYSSSETVTEAGRTNTTTKGDANQILFFRALFTGIPVQSADQIQFTCDHLQG